jgi:hypothetical protein
VILKAEKFAIDPASSWEKSSMAPWITPFTSRHRASADCDVFDPGSKAQFVDDVAKSTPIYGSIPLDHAENYHLPSHQ